MPVVVVRQEFRMRVEQHDLGQFREHWIDGMNVQGTEVGRKIALLLWRNGLVAEKQHLMFDHEFAETVDDGARQLSREIDAVNDGADDAVQPYNFDCHVRILGSPFEYSRTSVLTREKSAVA